MFVAVCSAKHAHYLLSVGWYGWEIIPMEARGDYRNWGSGKQETWTSNLQICLL